MPQCLLLTISGHRPSASAVSTSPSDDVLVSAPRCEAQSMNRREFVTVLGSATAWPLAAHAQQPGPMRRIGVLVPFAKDDAEGQALVTAFIQELQRLGWTEGRNLQIEY